MRACVYYVRLGPGSSLGLPLRHNQWLTRIAGVWFTCLRIANHISIPVSVSRVVADEAILLQLLPGVAKCSRSRSDCDCDLHVCCCQVAGAAPLAFLHKEKVQVLLARLHLRPLARA